MTKVIGFTSVMLAVLLLAQSASAQQTAKRARRPFDDYTRRPGVSPYLNLLNNSAGNVTNYQSLVRPLVNQQATNGRQSSAIKQLQQQMANRPSSSTAGSDTMRPTGHIATFGNYSHFYPSLQQ